MLPQSKKTTSPISIAGGKPESSIVITASLVLLMRSFSPMLFEASNTSTNEYRASPLVAPSGISVFLNISAREFQLRPRVAVEERFIGFRKAMLPAISCVLVSPAVGGDGTDGRALMSNLNDVNHLVQNSMSESKRIARRHAVLSERTACEGRQVHLIS